MVIARLRPDAVTEKFGLAVGECVQSVNGRPAGDLEALRQAVESGREPFLVIKFQSGTMLVLDRAAARAATERLMRRLEMSADYWNGP